LGTCIASFYFEGRGCLELPIGIVVKGIDAFLLVFVRMTGLFVISPIFGRRNIPAYFKIGFSFLLALIMINIIAIPELDYYNNIYQFVFLILKEFLVGLMLGYISYLLFSSIYIAGQLIDMQIGFGMVNVIDPMSNIQVPITSNFYFIMSMLFFLAMDGHHMLIRALFDSYEYVPLGGASFNHLLMNDIVRIIGNIFLIGFKIAAPITAAILVTDVALGVISKTVPQINVFVVGMPLKIFIGIAVMVVTIPMFVMLLETLVNGMSSEMLNFTKDMGYK
jgi:flagellar biosynthetic protein FliR